jgi:hypothetical protein
VGTLNTWVNSVTFNNLFPYSDAYTFYAGDCAGAIPNQNGNTGTPASAIVPAGGSVNVTARVPDMNITVTNKAPPLNGAHVKITQTGSGCTHVWRFTTGAYNLPGLPPANGQIPYETFPYGTYSICADDGTGTNMRTAAGTNTSPNGISVTLNMDKAANGLCN